MITHNDRVTMSGDQLLGTLAAYARWLEVRRARPNASDKATYRVAGVRCDGREEQHLEDAGTWLAMMRAELDPAGALEEDAPQLRAYAPAPPDGDGKGEGE